MSIALARSFRKRLTPQEARLWVQLRHLRRDGFHFRRQVPFLGYYLDFACFDRRLVIEVDGSQHGHTAGARRDAVRDAILEREGFRVLRFWNSEVNDNLQGVLLTVLHALSKRTPTGPLRGHPPHTGEG